MTENTLYRALCTLSRILSDYASLFIIGVAVVTFFLPDLFLWVTGYTQTFILGFIMLTMGLTLTVADMRILAARPWDILIGTCAQFTLMPLIAYTLTVVFHLDTALAVGIILVGCCPGGVSSNLMSYLCKGDVAFSVGMTTVSTLLAPVVTPALVLLLAGARVDVDAVGMFQNILIVTILPVGLGFLCNVTLGHNETFCQLRRVMPAFSVLGLACIVGGVVAVIHDDLIRGGLLMFLWTFVVVFCHNGLGYLFGYLAGRLFHFSKAKNRTISIEVGMQNAGLATNLATRFFLATCPLAIVPCAISCAWHSISGTLIATYFAWTDKRTTRCSVPDK
jgi:BASS family bile acid:Na+ symporter